jgi:hypothetical protein
MSFSVWVTGGDVDEVGAAVDAIAERVAARGLAVETLDERTPGVDSVAGDARAVAFVAETLARHGVVAVVALRIPARDARDAVRARVSHMIEVHVAGAGDAPGYEPPDRAEVEIDSAAGVARVLGTLEVLGFLPRHERRGHAEAEEREVIRRLKAFGYL